MENSELLSRSDKPSQTVLNGGTPRAICKPAVLHHIDLANHFSLSAAPLGYGITSKILAERCYTQ